MKKKILALVCAMTMVLGATMTVSAAESIQAGETLEKDGVTIETPAVSQTQVDQYVNDTRVYVDGKDTALTLTPVSMTVAGEAISLAVEKAPAGYKKVDVGVCTMVDINNNGEGGSFKLEIGTLTRNQTLKIFHKAGANWEEVNSFDLQNGYVTFSLSSTSPIAIITYTLSEPITPPSSDSGSTSAPETTPEQPESPKTGDPLFAVEAMAAFFAAAAGFAAKKRK